MTFDDFTQMVLPSEDRQFGAAALHRPHSRVGRFEPLLHSVESGVLEILHAEVDLAKRV